MTDDTTGTADGAQASSAGHSRRRFLGGALGAAGVVVGGGAGFGVARATGPDDGSTTTSRPAASVVPFYGSRQAGIATPAQDQLAFAAFDVTAVDPMALQVLLGSWAAAASQMTKGLPVGAVETSPERPPIDTGEATGLNAANLTITVGFGPSLFDDRFGLAERRPAALAPIPALPGDALQKERSGGDLCVQACADDPTVAFHVIRNFARLARGTAVMRWSQLGFGRTSSTSRKQETERNLLGFKDGTNNIKSEYPSEMDSYVWVGNEGDQAWMRGGSYLVARRIRMLIESWDTDYLADQERVFGRVKTSGAPLTGHKEFDPVNLQATRNGKPVIDQNAHIRLASPETNDGQKILRRGYSYTDGIDSDTGLLDAGLFFIAYQKDPRRQFVPIQRKLGSNDLLNEYIRHTGSALFAVPPGLRGPGDWWGKSLFA
ncbi:iron uptake transporter deferrochelatase/peroxidase subunit [uncultured Jatrophihabitans sp.]|uniref:iron uptake transporter deferrochelatase/peroxidase subunit n=1 Tax=uncultured Jatrophihabitans sp. TaxID=1610747 RepID=UPI0035CA9BB6